MSVELIAISAFIVAILAGLSQCIKKSNLKHCNVCGFDSDCRDENKNLEIQMKELNDKIEKNEKKINKNRGKLDILKNKKRLSNIADNNSDTSSPLPTPTPDSTLSTISFEDIVTEI